MMEIFGEDGISMNDDDAASRYNNYQVYLDLVEMGFSEEQLLRHLYLESQEQLEAQIREWEGEFGVSLRMK